MSPFLLQILHQLSYLGLFALLAGAAIVLPIPEELILLTAGYLLALGFLSWYGAVPAAILGLLVGDLLLFWLAKTGSKRIEKFRRRINHLGLEKTWLFAPSEPLRAVLILRFLTGFRFIAPLYAGFQQMSWRRYLLADLLVIILFVPGILFLGWYFHGAIVAFIAGFEIVRHALFLGILALAGVGMLPSIYRLGRRIIRK